MKEQSTEKVAVVLTTQLGPEIQHCWALILWGCKQHSSDCKQCGFWSSDVNKPCCLPLCREYSANASLNGPVALAP